MGCERLDAQMTKEQIMEAFADPIAEARQNYTKAAFVEKTMMLGVFFGLLLGRARMLKMVKT